MLDEQQHRSKTDIVWFIGSFFAGIILLVILRWPSLLDQSAVLAAIVLCAILGLYAFAAWRWGRFRLRRDDQVADNLYYLGFIFTICALGISLYRFSAAGEEGRVANIVGDLGVGILTTVLGLFLRVLFLQREDPADVEDRVQRELIDVAETTIAVIRQTGAVVEEGQVLVRQATDELHKTTEHLAEGMRELDRRLREIDIPSDMITSRLDPVLERTTQLIAGFAARIDSIDVSTSLLSRRLDAALANMKDAAPDLLREALLEWQKAWNGLLKDLRAQADEAINRIEKSFVSRASAIEWPAREIDSRTRKTLDRFDESTSHLVEKMRRMGTSVEQAEHSIAESPAALVQSLDTLRARMEDLFGQLDRHLARLGQRLDAVDVAHIGDALTVVDSQVQASREAVEKQRTAFAEQVGRLIELGNQIQSLGTRLLSALEEQARPALDGNARAERSSETAIRRWIRRFFNL